MTETALPLLSVLEAFLAWDREPDGRHRAGVADAIGGLLSGSGATGAFLAADPQTLPDLAVGWGTLADGPGERSGGGCLDLRASARGVRTGTLCVDPPLPPTHSSVRAIELALDAAWSRADARHAAERLQALDAATRGIAGLVPLEQVLQDIVDRVRDLIGARYAALGIVDEFGVIERFVTSGITRAQREAIGPLPRGHGLLGLIIRENRSYRIPDIAAHVHSHGFPPAHPEMRSFLGVPIQAGGRSVGNFYLTDKRAAAEFSAADEELVQLFALHAGVAIENARLHEQVQRMAIVDERVRIGKDLHDGIIQAIYGVGLSLEDVPDLMADQPAEARARIDRAIDSLNVAIRDIRNFIFGLQPELAEQGGLVAGLAALAEEFRLNSVIDVELDAADDLPEIGSHRRAELIKVVREALSNVVRHSKASRVAIGARLTGDELQLVIADNGVGFDPDIEPGSRHQGLRNMRTRAVDLGGALAIATDGAGTRVTVRVPAGTESEVAQS